MLFIVSLRSMVVRAATRNSQREQCAASGLVCAQPFFRALTSVSRFGPIGYNGNQHTYTQPTRQINGHNAEYNLILRANGIYGEIESAKKAHTKATQRRPIC